MNLKERNLSLLNTRIAHFAERVAVHYVKIVSAEGVFQSMRFITINYTLYKSWWYKKAKPLLHNGPRKSFRAQLLKARCLCTKRAFCP